MDCAVYLLQYAHHKHVQELYKELLKDVKGITLHEQPADSRYDSNFWLCAATIDPEVRIKGQENMEMQRRVAEEASSLYAPLAHKLGLYMLKSELEDLSLKYLEHDAYYMIKEKLSATKKPTESFFSVLIKLI